MADKNLAVFGIYPDQVSAGEGMDALRRIGFRNTDLSALLPDNVGSKDLGHVKNTKALKGAAAGALAGAAVGAFLAWAVANGMMPVPWSDRFVAAGPLFSAVTGAGAGFFVGWLLGALVGLGFPEYEARRYKGRMRHGGILLSAHCDNRDWTRRAADILKTTGATGIGITSESKADFGAGEKPWARTRVVGTRDPHTGIAVVETKPPEPLSPEGPPRVETIRPIIS